MGDLDGLEYGGATVVVTGASWGMGLDVSSLMPTAGAD